MTTISSRRSATIMAGALFAVTLILRIPIREHSLASVDSVDFALALERYDVIQSQPHPPGNFLYIAAAHVFQFLLHDATAALVSLSIFSSALAVAGLFLLGRHIFNFSTGLAAAVILLFSPVCWYYSEIAVTYQVEMTLVIACVWLLYDMVFQQRHSILAAVVLAIAGGFRIDTMVFLFPIYAWATTRVSLRRALFSWAALTITALAWVLPFLSLLTSVRSYLDLTRVQFPASLTVRGSGLDAVISNMVLIWHAYMWLFGGAILGLVFLGFLLLQQDRRDLFLLVVPLPALSFFLLGHFAQFGYLLVFSAPLFLLGARVSVLVSNMLGSLVQKRFPFPAYGPSVLLVTIIGTVSLINSFLFFHGNEIDQRSIFTTDSVSQVFGHFTSSTLRNVDTQTTNTINLIHQFKPEDTLIVSVEPYDNFTWRKLMYYLPDYRTVGIGIGPTQGVLFDAIYHYAPDYLYRHARLGEWKNNHFDIAVGAKYADVLVFGVSGLQVQITGLAPLPGDILDAETYLGHLASATDVINIGKYRIHQ